eukprot:g30672.t1
MLPEEVVEAGTIAAFKKHLDEYMNRKGIEGYGSFIVCVELQDMGEILNEYFSIVFTVEKDMKTWELGEVSGDILGTAHVTVEKVLGVLECMKVENSPGPDQFFDEVTRKVDEDIVYMDLSKVFDKVPR